MPTETPPNDWANISRIYKDVTVDYYDYRDKSTKEVIFGELWSTLNDHSKPWNLHDSTAVQGCELKLCPHIINKQTLETCKELFTNPSLDHEKWLRDKQHMMVEDITTCSLFCALDNETGTMIHGLKNSTKCQSKKNKSALYLYIHYIVML